MGNPPGPGRAGPSKKLKGKIQFLERKLGPFEKKLNQIRHFLGDSFREPWDYALGPLGKLPLLPLLAEGMCTYT